MPSNKKKAEKLKSKMLKYLSIFGTESSVTIFYLLERERQKNDLMNENYMGRKLYWLVHEVRLEAHSPIKNISKCFRL